MIEIKSLSKSYGGRRAVDGLSFTAPAGQVTGFVGPNGAGKSTTMRCLLGLDTPTSGAALIDGTPYGRLTDPAGTVGALLDPGWVNPARRARAHLAWVAATAGLPRRRVDEVLERVGLTEVAGKRVAGFSLGMRQRLGLAVALLGDPTHLVLDEPLNGLDPEGVRWMRSLIRDHADAGRTVLVSSHLLGELSLVADSVVMVGRGTLLGHRSVADLIGGTTAGTVTVRVDGDPAAATATAATHGWRSDATGGQDRRAAGTLRITGDQLSSDDVGRAFAAAGLVVLELRTETVSLEDAVMDLTRGHLEYATQEG